MDETLSDELSTEENSSFFSVDYLRTIISRFVTHTNRTAYEQRLFEVVIRNRSIPVLKVVLVSLAIVVALTWPTDFLLFKDSIVLWASLWRSSVILCAGGVYLGLTFSRWIERNITAIFTILAIILVGIMGFCLGKSAQLSQMETITTPWFTLAYIIPVITTLLSMRIGPRLLSTSLLTAVFTLSYLITYPFSAWASPYLLSSLIAIGSSVFIFTFLGHAIYHFNRRDFFRERQLQEERQKVERLASHDQLTGLKNYRSFHSTFEREFNRAQRYGNDLALLMMDLDYFKSINDNYGHLIGDRVLEEVGDLIKDNIRSSDVAARYGGEEFSVLLPETDLDKANELAERLRRKLKETEFKSGSESFTVTCSIGLAEFNSSMETPDDLIYEADQVLLDAKETGRDQVVRS